MLQELFPLIAFVAVAPFFWLYFQNKKKKELAELSKSALAIGLIDTMDIQEERKLLESMPSFNLFASGTNKRFLARFKGERDQRAFELLDYSHGQMATNSVRQRYLILWLTGCSSSYDFSLISKDSLHRWRKNREREEIELNQSALSDYRIYVHTNADLGDLEPLQRHFADQFSKYVHPSCKPRIEATNGQVIYYIRIKNDVTPERINALIDEGLSLLSYLP